MTTMATDPPSSFIARLIQEARRRARRRRVWLGLVAVTAAAVAAVSYTQLSRSSAAPPACRATDYRMTSGGQPATGNLIGAVDFAPRTSAACRLTTTVSLQVLAEDGTLLPIAGNPMRWQASGTLTHGQELIYPWRFGPLCDTPALTFVTRVAGGPVYRSTTPPANWKCDAQVTKQLSRLALSRFGSR